MIDWLRLVIGRINYSKISIDIIQQDKSNDKGGGLIDKGIGLIDIKEFSFFDGVPKLSDPSIW